MNDTEFKHLLKNSEQIAKMLQHIFPDPRDAIMSTLLIACGLASSAEITVESLHRLVDAMYKDMNESMVDTTKPMH